MVKRLRLVLLAIFFVSSSLQSQDLWEYPVRKGDSIWSLSHEMLTDWRKWQDVERLNEIEDDRKIKVGTRISFPFDWLRTEPAPGRVLKVGGRAWVQTTTTKPPVPMKPGMVIYAGDHIQTDAETSVAIEFTDGTVLLVQESSHVEVIRARRVGGKVPDTQIRLENGRVETRANPRKEHGSNLRLTTPVVSAAVRGTNFRVVQEEKIARLSVTSGKVEAQTPHGAVAVAGGQGTYIRAGEAPQPARQLLPKPQLADGLVIRYLPPSVTWSSLKGAKRYRIQVALDQEFRDLLFDRDTGANRVVLPMLADGTYFLRVRGVDNDGIGGKDAQIPFVIASRPIAPFLQTPRAHAVLRPDRVEFRWTEPEDINEFILEIAADEAFENPVIRQEGLTSTEFKPQSLLDPGIYWTRLFSVSKDSQVGPAGIPISFEVIPTPTAPKLGTPELEDQSITFRWPGDQKDRYDVQLSGEKTFEYPMSDLQIQGPEVSFDNLVPGNYYIRLRVQDRLGDPGPWGPPQKFEVKAAEWLLPVVLAGLAFLLML